MPLAVDGGDVGLVGEQEGGQLNVSGDDGQVQGGETLVVAALHEVGGRHDEEIGGLGGRDAVGGGAVMQGRFASTIALHQRKGLEFKQI